MDPSQAAQLLRQRNTRSVGRDSTVNNPFAPESHSPRQLPQFVRDIPVEQERMRQDGIRMMTQDYGGDVVDALAPYVPPPVAAGVGAGVEAIAKPAGAALGAFGYAAAPVSGVLQAMRENPTASLLSNYLSRDKSQKASDLGWLMVDMVTGFALTKAGRAASLADAYLASAKEQTPVQFVGSSGGGGVPNQIGAVSWKGKIPKDAYEASQVQGKKSRRLNAKLKELRHEIREKREARKFNRFRDDPLALDVDYRLDWYKSKKKENARLDRIDQADPAGLWNAKFKDELKLTNDYSKANLEAVPRQLKKEGWTVRHASSGRSGRKSSRYLVSPDNKFELRLSDHELPDTAERSYNQGRFGTRWDDELILGLKDKPSDVIAEIKSKYQEFIDDLPLPTDQASRMARER